MEATAVCPSTVTYMYMYTTIWVTKYDKYTLCPLGFQYRIGVCTPAVYMYTCTINGGDLSAVDILYGWKVEAMFFLGPTQLTLF